MQCYPGGAAITPGFLLPAKHVIHAVGPVWLNDTRDVAVLQSCYQNSLELAHQHKLMSIAFPCISTGIYGFPLEIATAEAISIVQRWLKKEILPIDVTFCCFSSREADLYNELLA
jgi:O-acetyl-ADP-ribose deacetylase (regulator of RNase III)